MASWQTALCPFKIEFAPAKLDEIRIAVMESFYAVPRGGVEIGGVLFGTREDGRLLICDYRKIETEYLTGPSFCLSEKDQAGLRTILQETTFPDPAVLPVGWFHSHTRSGIFLSESDLNIHNRYFPEHWQIAMVLKPDKLGNVRGGYFFRQAGGSLKADAAVEEFSLRPYFEKKRPVAEESTPPEKEKAEQPAPVEKPAPLIEKPTQPPTTSPLPVIEEPLLFRSLNQKTSWSTRKRVFVSLLAAASVAAAFGGYWVAIH